MVPILVIAGRKVYKKHVAKKADEKLAAAAAKERSDRASAIINRSSDDADCKTAADKESSAEGQEDEIIYEMAGDSEFVLPPPPYGPDDIGSPQRNSILSLSAADSHPVVAELEGSETMLKPEPLFTARSPVAGESETEMIPPIPQKSERRISTEL
ncbi:hypothetical protein BP6252_01896 [Coleophoma cylindrospora]|uniref:Uncharacterized protein n=1 Tax=Coleophoma cylindrospora TaxID=1849047 RepID=A0A3D8SD90_9HELO|nr:hypothetical protein BP6252_01896 [Coleophoma cylindrospora]